MAGSAGRNMTTTKGSNPFFDDDDDVDDATFLANAPKKPQNNGQDRLEQLLQEKKRIEERTLESSSRAKGILYETEKVGVTTAEELIRQREQLERTGDRLDNMNNSLRVSEKHIQNIKSVFSSFKNYFSKPDPPPTASGPQPGSKEGPASSSSMSSGLSKIVEQQSSASTPPDASQHPGLRIRGLDDEPRASNKTAVNSVDERLEQDLGDMSLSLSRLKGLAQGLSVELDDQNKLLDRLQDKTDKADWRIQRQNKDMERILKK